MKATGIVRKIDELGRVVIPKELRRTLRIRVGDPLEIFTERDGQIIFKKYSPISGLSNISKEYVEAIGEILECDAIICDKDIVLSYKGEKSKDYIDSYISKSLIEMIEKRQINVLSKDDIIEIIDREDTSKYQGQVVCPICLDGDPVGALVVANKRQFKEEEILALKTTVCMIEKQLDC